MSIDPRTPVDPRTPIDELPGLSRRVREKLAWLGISRLGDLGDRISYGELKRSRGIGPATLARLASLLEEAGLAFGERYRSAAALSPVHEDYQRAQAVLAERARAWVREHRGAVYRAWQAHHPGAYGDYLQAQLAALDALPAAVELKREVQHALVRQLNRYQREQRYAQRREALREHHRAAHGRRGHR